MVSSERMFMRVFREDAGLPGLPASYFLPELRIGPDGFTV
jgi:hypothetical protein